MSGLKKCIIFGVGLYGHIAFELLKDKFVVVFFSDSNSLKWGKEIEGVSVIPPDDIALYPAIEVVIAIKNDYIKPWEMLKQKGVYAKIFLPFYNIEKEKREYRLADLNKKDGYTLLNNEKFFNTTNFQSNSSLRKVLFVSTFFSPYENIATHRVSAFVKHLRKYNYEVIALTKGFCSVTDQIRDKTLKDDGDCFPIIRVQNCPILFEELSERYQVDILSMYREVIKSEGWMDSFMSNKPLCLIPDEDIIWVYLCLNTLKRKINLSEISCVVTSIGPFSLSFLGFYLKKEYNIKWINDYRDSWCLNENLINERYKLYDEYKHLYSHLFLEKELEVKLLEYTDYVTCISEEMKKTFSQKIKNVKCITNGYCEEDFTGLRINEKAYFEILFNGSYYPHYNLVWLLKLVDELINDNRIQKKSIKVTVNGRVLDKKNFSKLNRYDFFNYNGILPHRSSLESAYNADILLLFGGFNSLAYYCATGKIFEYLRLGKPILSFSSPFGLHYDMIEKRGRGITATYNDTEKVCNFILKQYNFWKQNGYTNRYEVDDYIRSFNRENLAEEMAKVLNKVISK